MQFIKSTIICWLPLLLTAHFSTSAEAAQTSSSAVPRVVFVLDNQAGNYLPILKGFREYARKHIGRLIRVDLVNSQDLTPAELSRELSGDYDLAVTIGEQATRYVIQTNKTLPIFSLKVNQAELRALYKASLDQKRLITGIFRDQPFQRFAVLIRNAFPQYQRVGLLISEQRKTLKPLFDDVMQQHELEPLVNIVRRNDLPQRVLERLAQKADIIITVYDEEVYSQENIKSHLLTAFRHQIPVIGVTRNYTDIGAAATLYTDNFELGKQAAKQVLKKLDLSNQVLEPIYPETFLIRVNNNVMHSLRIPLKDTDTLRQAVQQATY